jgi:hypothetical protein
MCSGKGLQGLPGSIRKLRVNPFRAKFASVAWRRVKIPPVPI